ncbi:hypothetical protein TSUD_94100 [Trifolium subterraneum]|uniref:Uncharacterized protein n=1 Tax=Trifolium subterraneum TaxID=3900 RepID=A0A2Z6PBC6_TRISU|nr:hypothetical protein TSUD_94100 [Trifolium subterraneum]
MIVSIAADSLGLSQSISNNNTLVSQSGRFELGFFTLGLVHGMVYTLVLYQNKFQTHSYITRLFPTMMKSSIHIAARSIPLS